MGGEIGRPRIERRKRLLAFEVAEEAREWAGVKKDMGDGFESLWEVREFVDGRDGSTSIGVGAMGF
jgi:hypothetical protein